MKFVAYRFFFVVVVFLYINLDWLFNFVLLQWLAAVDIIAAVAITATTVNRSSYGWLLQIVASASITFGHYAATKCCHYCSCCNIIAVVVVVVAVVVHLTK